MKFSEILINERKKRGWSQETLAQKLDISRQSISKWETEQAFPDLPKLIQLSELFDLSIDELCGKKQTPTNNGKCQINRNTILMLIILILIGIFIGSRFSSQHSISNQNIEIASVHADCTYIGNATIYVTPTYIHKNATYKIIFTPYSIIPLTESKKAFLKDNIFSATFETEKHLTYDVSLEISYKDETIILPLYHNFRNTAPGSYSYTWSATQK